MTNSSDNDWPRSWYRRTAHRLPQTHRSNTYERIWRITKCHETSRSLTNCRVAAPARSPAASCRTAPTVRRRRFPLLRAVAELANAATGVQPLGREGYIALPVFAFGWPTTE